MVILVTGGAGFIGSQVALACLEAGHRAVVLDNFSNSSHKSLDRVNAITGLQVECVVGDVRDTHDLDRLFKSRSIDLVIHCAGLKSVAESSLYPISYYDNNVAGTFRLVESMLRAGLNKLIFSSSATVYGDTHESPKREEFGRGTPSNVYGCTKSMVEQFLEDVCWATPCFSVVNLRYFNPVGAHSSGLLGEEPSSTPNNLMPILSQVAAGRRSVLEIYGNDYDTADGTCERDFVHIMDLAQAHMHAIRGLEPGKCQAFNIGTGQPTSVLKLIEKYMEINRVEVAYTFTDRRSGDLPVIYADPAKARDKLSWTATRTLEDMVRDEWLWQCYRSSRSSR